MYEFLQSVQMADIRLRFRDIMRRTSSQQFHINLRIGKQAMADGLTGGNGMAEHRHSPEHKKRTANRLARAIGHLESVKRIVEDDRDCAEILIQLAAVRVALTSAGKEIINEHMEHCVQHAIEDGDTQALDDFRSALNMFL